MKICFFFIDLLYHICYINFGDIMSDFIKEMKKQGKIRPISEAFEEFPVELEYHKGDANYFIKEKKVVYGKYNIGDIVFVKEYEYDDGKKGTDHLFVIIDENNICTSLEYFGMTISSNLEKLKYDSNVLLKKDDTNNLDKDSIVKTDRMYVLIKENIIFKIGEVSLENIEIYKKKLESIKEYV